MARGTTKEIQEPGCRGGVLLPQAIMPRFVGFLEEETMKHARLLSTVAATLLFAGAASAQELKKDENPAPAPAAQQNAPAEKLAPNMKAGQKNAETHKPPETTGQAPKTSDADKPTATDKTGGNPTDANGTLNEKPKSATTGQGAAAGSAKLSTEQRGKIAGIIRQQKVEPAHLTVSVNVGTRVPESVHVYPLPVEVVAVYPEWRGYDYILVGDQIVVIDPDTHEIVAILEA